jgi:hypothetical protein
MSILQVAAALVGARRSPRAVTPAAPARRDPVEGEPLRRAAIHRIASLLGDLSRDESRILVDQVVRAFGRRVYDIPASEKHHHCDPWGLLDHSIEVAEYAVRSALGANFMDSVAPYPEEQEFRVPRLRYAAFLFGLFHDVGKVLGVSVQSGRRVWNPFAEDLAEFAKVSAGNPPSMLWRVGRGVHAHEYPTAYLLSLFLPGAVAEYLTAPLLMELLERRSSASMRVFDIVAKADQRSTKEDLDRRERTKESSVQEPLSYPELSVGYRELVVKAFTEGIREDLFAANTLDGDFWVGREYVALRYPTAVGKLAQITRERLGPVSQKARMLPAGDAGARELANHLSELDLIFRDAQTGAWKVQMAVTQDGNFQVTAAVLFKRSLLFPGTAPGEAPEPFSGGVTFTRPSDNSEMAIQGFLSLPKSTPPMVVTPQAVAPATPHNPAPRAPAVDPVKPKDTTASTAESPRANPALMATLRSNLLPGVLLEDIRQTILGGKISVNQWNAQVYVLLDRTYFVTPNGFRKLVEQGLYSLDPSKAGSAYLDALAKLDCVLKVGSSGRVVSKIRLRENAKPCSVVTFLTRGLFKTDLEIARVGLWTETQIVEECAPTAPVRSTKEKSDD